MMISPEECYACWHREYHKSEGKYVRAVKNFSKAKTRDYWCYFEQFAQMVNRNAGNINYSLFITILAEQYGGYYHPSLLTKRRSLKIYRSYIKEKDLSDSPEHIKKQMLESIQFMVNYCRSENITSFLDYFRHNMYTVPSLLKHLNAGSISPFLLACIPHFDEMLSSYPVDVVQEFGKDMLANYSVYRHKILHIDDKIVKTLINNNEDQFDALINMKKDDKKNK
jgi:hypothetical protein